MENFQYRRSDDQFVPRFPFPIPHLLITGTGSGSAQTVLTVLDNQPLVEVRNLVVTNTTGTAATITMHSVPSGDSIATANAEVVGLSVPANSTAVLISPLNSRIGGMYEAGATLQVWSDTNGALVIHGHGQVIQSA